VYTLVTTIVLTLLMVIAITLIFTNRRITELLRTVRSVDEGVAEVVGMNTRAVSKTITDTGAQRAIRRSS
jgi:branched-subunit amino acid ABC-type transport system permease component